MGGVLRNPNGARSRGFTLLEMIIVLAILALVVALAWPTLRRPLAKSVTQEAARQLARDLAHARLLAIDCGQTMALRFEPGGYRYTVKPAESQGQEDQAEALVEDDVQPALSDDQPAPLEPETIESQLDEDVKFTDPAAMEESNPFGDSTLGDTLQDEMQQTEAVSTLMDESKAAGEAGLLGEDQDQVGHWSSPVLFYATGRSENAEFLLQGPDGYSVTVTLRGLTGAVTVGPLSHPLRTVKPAADQQDASGQFRQTMPTEPGPSPESMRGYR